MAEGDTSPVAVITGASEGLGLALAYEFARGGHAVMLVARRKKALEAGAKKITQATGAQVYIHTADLSTRKGCESIGRALVTRGLHAEFLVNNAAIGVAGPLVENDSDDLMRLADLNVRAYTDLTRRMLPGMIARDSGGVLNIASLAGFLPGPYQAAYYASKAYILSLSEALAWEVSRTNVRVCVVAPGPLNTGFHGRMKSQNDFYLRFMGVMNVDDVARIAYAGFMNGRKVIVPGLINHISAMFMRVIPHSLLVPFAAWLLKRREGAQDA